MPVAANIIYMIWWLSALLRSGGGINVHLRICKIPKIIVALRMDGKKQKSSFQEKQKILEEVNRGEKSAE
jgi:hypothetical protein